MNGETGPGQAARRLPVAGWPAKGDLDYVKVAVEVALLLLAIPWIIRELFRHPGELSHKAASKHLKG